MRMKRNYGVDFLRILSMFMAVVVHVLGQGGILRAVEAFSFKFWIVWFLEIAFHCALNCFALISGYVMYKSRTKLAKALNIWLQVVFYTIGAVIAVAIIKPKYIGLSVIADAIFPITRTHYWYISSYFGLLLFQPLLNLVIEHAERKLMCTTLLVALVMFSVFPSFLLSDPYCLEYGYSFIWLILLYLVGAYIHKYNIAENAKKSTAWLTFAGALLLTFGFQAAMQLFPQDIFPTFEFQGVLLDHTSPTMILMGVSLLIALSKQNFGVFGTKMISFCAPAALGVYLIHVNKLVWQYLFKDFAKDFVQYHWVIMILLIFAAAIAIYAVCILVEKVRIWLFKLVKIPVLCQKIEQWAEKLLNKHIPV